MKLRAKNLTKTYEFYKHFYSKKEEFKLFENINFELKQGQNLLIKGESGSGKSTLAKILCMIEKPSLGEVFLAEHSLFKLNQAQQRLKRKDIQYVFSDAKLCLNPYKKINTLLEQVFYNFNQAVDRVQIEKFFKYFNLKKELLNLKVLALSGGEATRINLIRALLVKPKFLILDEVFANLDLVLIHSIIKYLKFLQMKQGLSFIFISHKDEFLKDFKAEILELKKT